MDITMLGGAEIGATCIWFRTATTQWLVDAGTRMNELDPLPNLALLETQQAKIDAIFITHAHQDHIGALPLISSMFPTAPVYMTQATLAISKVMLADALHLSRQDGHAKVFTEDQLDQLWPRIHVMGQDKVLSWQGIRVSTYSAGHILGAVAIGFETNDEGSVLFTGDYSVAPGRLIGGLRIPHGTRYDAVISESTYGSRLHENRAQQEKALAQQVSDVIQQGGFVLIPAFAVGRAQEVLMILQNAMRYNKEIKPFPIVVDGLVRSICPIYESYPHLLQGPAKRLIHTKGRLFSPEDIFFVKTAEQRQSVVQQGKPCCVISSSGMLSGGPAIFYAHALVGDAKNAVLLTGYQDEESPGRLLLTMAKESPEERRWILPDRVVPVRAKVGLYALSAHADRRELAQVVAHVRPHAVWLVHGDEEAKAGLTRELRSYLPSAHVHAAVVGESFNVPVREPAHIVLPQTEEPIRATSWKGQVLAFKENDVLLLGYCTQQAGGTCHVTLQDGTTKRIPVDFVKEPLGRVPAGESPNEYMVGLIAAAKACIEDGRYFGYRSAERLGYLIAEQGGLLPPADPYGKDEVMDKLEPYGWRKTEAMPLTQVFRVFVAFPWAIPDALKAEIEGKEVHGWRYQIEPQVYPPALQKEIEKLAHRYEFRIQPPKVFTQEQRILVPITSDHPTLDTQLIADQLQQVVGGKVHVMRADDHEQGSRLEQNEAMRRIREIMPDSLGVYKIGADTAQGIIKVSVYFPDAVVATDGAKQVAAEAQKETGWRVAWATHTHMEQLAAAAIRWIESTSSHVVGSPAIYQDRNVVKVKMTQPLSDEEKAIICPSFHQQTGWTLQFAGDHHADEAVVTPMQNGTPRTEINQALRTIEEMCTRRGVTLYKKSLKNNRIELAFITPEWGHTQSAMIEELRHVTGWEIVVSDKVQQQALIRLAEQITPGVIKTPSVYL
ncbi:MBL fold metallo-hydrolase, partial [Sulfoacidibacillus ferrooxidans]|uniref:MBL fold metallo-hydrolase n=1 Tax=Sulfoacidibacillus ferrooxidans TaxID=2005001 RepID=UPI001F511608